MGYFSNPTESEIYQQNWCRRCAHESRTDFCPIWELHLTYNFDQRRPTEQGRMIERILMKLIPIEKGILNGECRMFKERDDG